MLLCVESRSLKNKTVAETIEEVLGEIGENPVLRDACRIGLKNPDSIRPTSSH